MRRAHESVAFDTPTAVEDDYGGMEEGWTEQFSSQAEFIYQRGREAELSGDVTGSAMFKVKIYAHENSRAITTKYRMRDKRRGVVYNIREVDAISDRRYVWLMVERGVAV